MTKAVAVLALIALGTPCFGKHKHEEAAWQEGRMVYHPPIRKNLLADVPASDLYYQGDYTCIAGHGNQGPDCAKNEEWIIDAKHSYTEFFTAEGTLLYRVEFSTKLLNVFRDAQTQWFIVADGRDKPRGVECHEGNCNTPQTKAGVATDSPTEVRFRYRTNELRGVRSIDIAVPGVCTIGCIGVSNDKGGWMIVHGEIPSDFPIKD